MMTKKHYNVIYDAIRKNMLDYTTSPAVDLEGLLLDLLPMMQADNPAMKPAMMVKGLVPGPGFARQILSKLNQ